MKKRILFISLALVLVLTALAPAEAFADNGKRGSGVTTGGFTGSGLIYVTYMPDPIIKGKIWRYQGEIVEGFLDQCDWAPLAGTVFWSDHDSVVRVDDEGNASGVMKGMFTLARPDGTGVLEGTFTGRIRGNLYTGDITDEGSWKSTSGDGVFEDVKASGRWSAELHLGIIPGTSIPTLLGPVIWEGKYITHNKLFEIYRQLRPVKPDKPVFRPGKVIKPWKPVRPWESGDSQKGPG